MANQTHGSLAAQAATHLREIAGAVGGSNGIQSEIKRQADHLLEWAWERGLTLADSYTAGLERIGIDTVEHAAYLNVSDNRVVKCTKPGKFGRGHEAEGKYATHPDATPLFYLERLEFMNQEFPTDIRLAGVGLGNPDYGNREEVRP
jgi:hypothetical protein